MENIEKSPYNFAFINNSATVYIYKSNRKNAKIVKCFNINHLITHDSTRKVAPDKMKDQFLSILEPLSYYTEAGNINISVSCIEGKNAIINGGKCSQSWYWNTEKLHFDSFTTAAHWLYFNLFCRIYPYCEIDFTEIEMDNNYKFLLNEWKTEKEKNR